MVFGDGKKKGQFEKKETEEVPMPVQKNEEP